MPLDTIEGFTTDRSRYHGDHSASSLGRRVLKYQRLKFSVNEIRLISIETAENSSLGSVLKCSLEHHILEAAPKFFALSYNWGNPGDTELIQVNNCGFYATRNLVDALRALRTHGRIRVWADALCINQQDYEEKSLQLLRMGSIYRAAFEVCIWLGPVEDSITTDINQSKLKATKLEATLEEGTIWLRSSDENSINTFDGPKSHAIQEESNVWVVPTAEDITIGKEIIFDIDESNPRATQEGTCSRPWYHDGEYSLKLSADGFIEVERGLRLEVVRYLRAALVRPYWERLWILQEISVAGQIVVFFGRDAINWNDFTATFIAARLALPASFPRLETLISLRDDVIDTRPPPFFTALCDTHASKATVPRDRLYGLLGVTLDGAALFPTPNYEHSHAHIFRDLTIKQVSSQKRLDFILLNGKTSLEELERPSWVPDWLLINPRSYAWRVAQIIRAFIQRRRTLATEEHWHASRYAVANASSMSIHGSVLRIRACYVASIGSISTEYEDGLQSGDIWNLDGWTDRAQTPPWNESSVRTLDRLRELFVYGADEQHRDAGLSHIAPLINSMLGRPLGERDPGWYAWMLENCEIRIADIALHEWLKRAAQLGDSNTCAANHWKAIATTWWQARANLDRASEYVEKCLIKTLKLQMRLFSTSNGYCGWAHPQAEPWDGIFLIAGCSLPVILRSVPGAWEPLRYQVVGDAYVPGLMNGEAYSEKRLATIDLV